MKASPAAFDLLNAHKALRSAALSLEQAATQCKPGACKRKLVVTVGKVSESMANTEELAHLAATGGFK